MGLFVYLLADVVWALCAAVKLTCVASDVCVRDGLWLWVLFCCHVMLLLFGCCSWALLLLLRRFAFLLLCFIVCTVCYMFVLLCLISDCGGFRP